MQSSRQRRPGEAVLGMALLLLLGVFQSASSVKFEVKDKNNTCIMADLSINFTVQYNATGKQEKATFVLPANASVDPNNSTCGTENKTAPLLVIKFGNNHSLSVNFTKSQTVYQVDELVFVYNLSDRSLFPSAAENGTKEVFTNKTAISADSSSFYNCINPHLIMMGGVNATFHNVKLEAYLKNNNYSTKATPCSEDYTPTPVPTLPPTTAPVNPKTPDTGDYMINTTSGATCILAKMGLQLNVTYTNKTDKEVSYEFNVDPKEVTPSGNCTNSTATLLLSSATMSLLFTFTLNTTEDKFYLHYVGIDTAVPDGKAPRFAANNGSLSYLQTAAHKSYKCNVKQTFQITNNFTVDAYSLQVQAFDIKEHRFGPAVECSEDQNGMLVPIVVGAALAGLVLIVLIAYLIGRKRSHAGYQTI